MLKKLFHTSKETAWGAARTFSASKGFSSFEKRFNPVDENDLAFFTKTIGAENVILDKAKLDNLNLDWMRKFRGNSKVALFPGSTEEVSKLLRHCNDRRLPIVPQGGNTSLAGASVPVFDEVILNLRRMSKLISLDEHSGIALCEAGTTLLELDQWVQQKRFVVPLDLAVKSTCQIGGNIATNAGGLRLLRFGSLHGTVLGLEVVLADGTVVDMLSSMRKDNTGYDMKQLFIGSEGTLGVITKAAVLCPQRPMSTQVCFMATDSYDKIPELFTAARNNLGEILSAFEFLDDASMTTVKERIEGVEDPFVAPHEFYVLVEVAGSNGIHDWEKMSSLRDHVLRRGLAQEVVLAKKDKEARKFWHIRENISESLRRRGVTYKYDLSMPMERMYSLVHETRERIGKDFPEARVVGYGHVGDGNLHLNVSLPEHDERVLARVEPFVYEWIRDHQGSVSAEHGLGAMKPQYLPFSKSGPAIDLMRRMKAMLDPHKILNPYKVLESPPTTSHVANQPHAAHVGP